MLLGFLYKYKLTRHTQRRTPVLSLLVLKFQSIRTTQGFFSICIYILAYCFGVFNLSFCCIFNFPGNFFVKSRAKLQKTGFFLYTRFQPLAVRTISAEKFGLVDKSHLKPSRISSQLLFLLPCHNGHQQGGRQQLLRRGACPHKG